MSIADFANIRVTKDILRRIKIHCATTGKSISGFVSETVIKELDRLEKQEQNDR